VSEEKSIEQRLYEALFVPGYGNRLAFEDSNKVHALFEIAKVILAECDKRILAAAEEYAKGEK
jgi:hypothetical protein